MKNLSVIFLITIIFSFIFFNSKAQSESVRSYMRCFSDVSYIPEEDEYVGTVIIVMLHQDKISIVFQEASGVFLGPVVVDGKWDKDYITFELPSSVFDLKTPLHLWKAKYKDNNLLLISPIGDESTLRSVCE